MKLSKALKLKNKKVNEYNNLVSKMVNHNSYDVDTKQTYNSTELYLEVIDKREDLIKFKTAIHLTSEPIREKIFRIGEYKNLLINLNRLSTTEGVVKSRGYGESDKSTYACSINELQKVEMMEWYQNEIENIQDEIDTFNATTELVGY
jgi:hypothetical protein